MAQTNNSYIDSLKKEFVTMDSTQRKLFINAIKFDTQNYNTKKRVKTVSLLVRKKFINY